MPAGDPGQGRGFLRGFPRRAALLQAQARPGRSGGARATPARTAAAGTTNERRVPLPLVAAEAGGPALRARSAARCRGGAGRSAAARSRSGRGAPGARAHAGGACGAAQGRGDHGRETTSPASFGKRRPGCASQRGAPPDVDPSIRRSAISSARPATMPMTGTRRAACRAPAALDPRTTSRRWSGAFSASLLPLRPPWKRQGVTEFARGGCGLARGCIASCCDAARGAIGADCATRRFRGGTPPTAMTGPACCTAVGTRAKIGTLPLRHRRHGGAKPV